VAGHLVTPQRNRYRQSHSVSRDLDLSDHRCRLDRQCSFSRPILLPADAGADLLSVSALLAWTRTSNLRVVANPNTGNSVFRVLPAAGVHAVRRVRSPPAIAGNHSPHFRAVPADILLPRVSIG